MKPEIKKLWTAALRSGEYKQGNLSLVRYKHNTVPEPLPSDFVPNEEQLKTAQFCCLGVLCEVYRKTTGKNLWGRTAFGWSFGLPPRIVLDWAGLITENPKLFYKSDKVTITMAELNDEYGVPFETLADLIDQQL